MSGDFLDSNVIVYSFDPKDPRKQTIASGLIVDALVEGSALISFQVVQEVLSYLTRRPNRPLASPDADQFLRDVLAPLWRVMPDESLYARTLQVHGRYRFSFYDSLIVAAALQADCRRLLTEDLQHGQTIEGLRIENPFLSQTS